MSLIAQPAPAGTSPQQVGTGSPVVWLGMNQSQLDDAYNQAKYAPNIEQVLSRYASASEAARAQIGQPRRMQYGETAVESLDIYASSAANAPVNIFLHGGAWRMGLAQNYAFPAEMFVRAGAHLVVPDFNNVIETGGDLMPMAEQCRRAVAWVYRHIAEIGGDPERIFICGHSSGAHLGGTLLIADWVRLGLPQDVIKGALLCSGMYDLKPVRLSARSAYVKFTDAVEEALSTQRHLRRINCPVVVAYGALETPEFQRQSRAFAAALQAAAMPVRLLVGEDCNHFEVIESLANPYGLLGRAVLAQMKLDVGR